MKDLKKGHLLVLPCHCVYDRESDTIYAEHPEDRPVYENQIRDAWKRLYGLKGADPFLVISGGATKVETHLSEAASYFSLAESLGFAMLRESTAEEFALTSVENLLFSIYRFRMVKGAFPESIEVVSWDFKETRYRETLRAINKWQGLNLTWEGLDYTPSGVIKGKARIKGLAAEREYVDSLKSGLGTYYSLQRTETVIKKRDVHDTRSKAAEYYRDFKLPF